MCAYHSARPAPDDGAAFKRPADIWTWDRPLGRALSAVVGVWALVSGGVLGGLLWTFWVALLAPDIALFYDARNAGPERGQLSPRAARLYNVLHNPGLALATIALGAATVNRPLLVAGLAWVAHIGIDRAMGYGPRRRDGRFHRIHMYRH
jgi:uncharacterized MnhB-related membrane protein